jgi:hypothetical protein
MVVLKWTRQEEHPPYRIYNIWLQIPKRDDAGEAFREKNEKTKK